MEYSFIYELDKIPQDKRRETLHLMSDKQLELLYYIYIKKITIQDGELRQAILNSEFNGLQAKELSEIISFIIETEEFNEDTRVGLVIEMLSYISAVGFYAGPVEARKAAKVLLCKKRVVGIKARDILEELNKRKNKKNMKKVKKTC